MTEHAGGRSSLYFAANSCSTLNLSVRMAVVLSVRRKSRWAARLEMTAMLAFLQALLLPSMAEMGVAECGKHGARLSSSANVGALLYK